MDEAERGAFGVVVARETVPIMQQLIARLESTTEPSGADQQAMITALQTAFVAGGRQAGAEWELPYGDQWARDHGQDGV
jgi:hypothetical protein